ncbi:MAG TPA: LuxR C-terminal-related transcriptional regulator [Actinophytocola sp.]|uniref:ATP-binding protein n=1 Tax=Actinophytocola sp. TaxID=1872138 RepID=UPI002DDD96E4|nr:LuxR C-terminal-related transcriptional regulator [Actinophytocola sp.]HEV2779805.1 LuxR C-terminal-related transcriptional regulator [Actinophytocola sp.]
MRDLLEREEPLAVLRDGVRAAGRGRGGLVLIGGEAGIGKTTLVRHVAAEVGSAWLGACDPLETPRALGPLLDMAPDILAGSPSRGEVLTAVLARLSEPDAPALVIVEDLHWADQATFDLLRFLGRRVDRLRTLLAVTFRDDEAPAGSPLAVFLGDLATTPGVTRLTLRPLSIEATGALVGDSGADARSVYERTGGNPFFINAVLASGGDEVPATVREAVLARLARVAPDTRAALETAATFGPRVDPAVLGVVLDALDIPRWTMRDGVFTGLLRWQAKLLEFRHELVQAAIAETTAPRRRQRLHGAIFQVLQRISPEASAELARHAEGAGDDRAVLELAPRAAEWAAGRAAHREATALYRKAIDRAREEPAAVRADLLEKEAAQRYLAGELAAARDGHRAAAAVYRTLGDRLGEGRNLVRVSALSFLTGNYADVDPAAGAVESVLAGLPPSRELAMAYDNQSRQRFMAGDAAGAADWAGRALAVAEQLDDPDPLLTARISLAGARLSGGDLAAIADLRALLRSAHTMRHADDAARAMLYLGWLPIQHRHYAGVEAVLDRGLAFTTERGMPYWEQLIAGARVTFLLDKGRWAEVEPAALGLLNLEHCNTLTTMHALVALGRVRARRAEPDPHGLLDRLRDLAVRHHQADLFTLASPALAEAAWLAGDARAVVREVRDALERGSGVENPWWLGELACWAHRAGASPDLAGPVAEPYRLALAGDWAAAAEWWSTHDCPFETAVALSAGDQAAVAEAVGMFDRLGARAAAAAGRRRLRELGVAAIPRGPRAETAANRAGLTRRESEVLDLLALGLTNTEIAQRLYLSGKTVERHVSAVLRKLDARSRAEAVGAARRVGVLPPS